MVYQHFTLQTASYTYKLLSHLATSLVWKILILFLFSLMIWAIFLLDRWFQTEIPPPESLYFVCMCYFWNDLLIPELEACIFLFLHLFFLFPKCSSHLETISLFSVYLWFCLLVFIWNSIYKWNHRYLSFSVQHISLRIIPSMSIHVISGMLSSFLMAV